MAVQFAKRLRTGTGHLRDRHIVRRPGIRAVRAALRGGGRRLRKRRGLTEGKYRTTEGGGKAGEDGQEDRQARLAENYWVSGQAGPRQETRAHRIFSASVRDRTRTHQQFSAASRGRDVWYRSRRKRIEPITRSVGRKVGAPALSDRRGSRQSSASSEAAAPRRGQARPRTGGGYE